MKVVSAAMATHLEGDVTTLATCWKLVRQDGTEFHFTDHDQDILYLGDVYVSAAGYDRSAIENDSSLAVDNLDILGLLDNAAITEEDLRNGLYDYAKIEVFMVNWMDLSMGEISLRAGRLGEVTVTHTGTFTAELRGLSQALSQRIGELYSVQCRADLGDTRCGVVLTVATEWEASTTYAVGNMVIPTTGKDLELPLPFDNMSAEDGDATGWTGYQLSLESGAEEELEDVVPLEGDFFFYLKGLVSGACYYQDKTLAELGFAVGDEIYFEGYQANPYADDTGWLTIRCKDASDITLAEASSTAYANSTLGEWTYHATPSLIIPATTEYIRIYMYVNKVSGTYGEHAFDALYVLKKGGSITKPWPVYFECTTAGDSDASEPTWPETAGETVAETGGAVWESKIHHATVGEVVVASSTRVFTCSVLGEDYPKFDGGTVEWTSGNNLGKISEIKNAGYGSIELYLPLNYEIQTGDTFILVPGCTKKLFTCRDTFNNVLNFRGEPYIPGQDEYLSYPDAK